MCNPPFATQSERVKTLLAIRKPNIEIPEEFENDSKHKIEIQLLQWLLDHNPNNRPSSEELLQSSLVPATRLEANELQEMLRHVLANPQSRGYKHLISRCLAQDSSIVDEVTYHMGLVPISPVFENVKNKIVMVLRKHGAIDITTPLLTPYSKKDTSDSAVRLMTHSGSVVTLPYDLRKPFLRYVALNGINFMRRYSIGRVYREKKMFNFHPKQILECAFDIVTPNRGNLLVDAEILAITQEIVNEFEVLKDRNLMFRVNHTSLLRSVFLYYSIPPEKYKKMLTLINDLQVSFIYLFLLSFFLICGKFSWKS
jgi:translation initiation factor 2-alpha kinase 4